jgi:hypothetical protein
MAPIPISSFSLSCSHSLTHSLGQILHTLISGGPDGNEFGSGRVVIREKAARDGVDEEDGVIFGRTAVMTWPRRSECHREDIPRVRFEIVHMRLDERGLG